MSGTGYAALALLCCANLLGLAAVGIGVGMLVAGDLLGTLVVLLGAAAILLALIGIRWELE